MLRFYRGVENAFLAIVGEKAPVAEGPDLVEAMVEKAGYGFIADLNFIINNMTKFKIPADVFTGEDGAVSRQENPE